MRKRPRRINGITQIVVSLVSIFLGFCWAFTSVSVESAPVPSDPFSLVMSIFLPFMIFCLGIPLSMYVWSVFDGIKIYKHSQEKQ
ncbi:MAG: hypothetical protein ABIM88_00460 [candidate division WOR-3 bacterium]